MTTSQRVIKRLTDMGINLPEGVRVERTYSGPWQKAAGAWSWTTAPMDAGGLAYGSQRAASDLLKCANWIVEAPNRRTPDLTIDPCATCQREKVGACRRLGAESCST